MRCPLSPRRLSPSAAPLGIWKVIKIMTYAIIAPFVVVVVGVVVRPCFADPNFSNVTKLCCYDLKLVSTPNFNLRTSVFRSRCFCSWLWTQRCAQPPDETASAIS